MSLRSLIIRKLDDAAGVYQPNHFLISLDAATPFISGADDNPRQDNSQLHVFIHEYWHYWHNISTVSGFKSFAFTQHLLANFGNTLLTRADGTSEGTSALRGAAKANVATLLDLSLDLDGDDAPRADWASDFDLTFKVTGAREISSSAPYQGGKAPNPRVVLDVAARWTDGSTAVGEMVLGSLAIEESVAYLVEEQVRRELAGAPAEAPPEFPYRVAERVYEYAVGASAPTSYYPAALGTLALMAVHPGTAFLAFCGIFKKRLDATGDEAQALREVLQGCQKVLTKAVDTILDSDLQELVAMHGGRGLLEGALTHVAGLYRRSFELRKGNLLFDLDLVFPKAKADDLLAHQASFPPCDLLQERVGDGDLVGRDAIFSFDATPEDRFGHRPTDYTRSFQAQQDYLYAHVDLAKLEFIDSADARSRCPFYSACDLQFRKDRADLCGCSPWQSYGGAGHGCWYSTAVAASLGPVKVKKTRGAEG